MRVQKQLKLISIVVAIETVVILGMLVWLSSLNCKNRPQVQSNEIKPDSTVIAEPDSGVVNIIDSADASKSINTIESQKRIIIKDPEKEPVIIKPVTPKPDTTKPVIIVDPPAMPEPDVITTFKKGQPVHIGWIYAKDNEPEKYVLFLRDSTRSVIDSLAFTTFYNESTNYHIKMFPQGWYYEGVLYLTLMAYKNNKYNTSPGDTIKVKIENKEWTLTQPGD